MLGIYPISNSQNPQPDIPQLPDYAGQAGQAVNGMFAASPPPAPKRPGFFAPGGFLTNFVQNYVAGLGNPSAQAAIQAQNEREQQQAQARAQMFAPQHIGDSLIQRNADGTYSTLWTKPDAPDDPKPTEQQRNYDWLKTIDPTLADSYIKNVGDPVRWMETDDPRTGAKVLVPVNHNGPLGMQTQGASNPLDSVPTVEEGYSYTPGPGGRANQANWKPTGGPSLGGSGGFRQSHGPK